MKKLLFVLFCFIANCVFANDADYINGKFINFEKSTSNFAIHNAPVFVDQNDYEGVLIAAENFVNDIKKVSDGKAVLNKTSKNISKFKGNSIIVGTIGKSKLIDNLIEENKINVDAIKGKWETFGYFTIEPKQGIKVLVIAGSDKRASIFGLYELSKNMGVSPWEYFLEVPVAKHKEIYFESQNYTSNTPRVQYRGIFLNDEEPCLGRWAVEKFGGFNHQFYSHVFELCLRLKMNFMWPAMWWAAFNYDDKENAILADKMGIVMGNSHHEPMNRAHQEWHKGNVKRGAWNFATNADELKEFWKQGIINMGDKETVVTLGMRGDGDEAMEEGTNIKLMESIVSAQRQILKENSNKSLEEIPQVWALYKEVLDYYEKGMKVPEDVILLLCDDNWGNIRRLPSKQEQKRKGGFGMYWHYDYVGGPRSYRWINTNTVEHFFEQYSLALDYNVDKLWIVNVGDLKHMELPISFFADYAFEPQRFTNDNINMYYNWFVSENITKDFKANKVIANAFMTYARINFTRKPELVDQNSFTFKEFAQKINALEKAYNDALEVSKKLSKEIQNTIYLSGLWQLKVTLNLYKMYYCAKLNDYFFKNQNKHFANLYADSTEYYFNKDKEYQDEYNKNSNGKWNNFANQTHIGYTSWDNPKQNICPKVERLDKELYTYFVENNFTRAFEGQTLYIRISNLEQFDNTIKLFSTQKGEYKVSGGSWDNFSIKTTQIKNQLGIITFDIKENNLDFGHYEYNLTLSQDNKSIFIKVLYDKFDVNNNVFKGNGQIDILAKDGNITGNFVNINGGGRFASAVTFKDRNYNVINYDKNHFVEYKFYISKLEKDNQISIDFFTSPTLDFLKKDHKIAYSIDNNAVQYANIHQDKRMATRFESVAWEKSVINSCYQTSVKQKINQVGEHTLRIYLSEPSIVFENITIKY